MHRSDNHVMGIYINIPHYCRWIREAKVWWVDRVSERVIINGCVSSKVLVNSKQSSLVGCRTIKCNHEQRIFKIM